MEKSRREYAEIRRSGTYGSNIAKRPGSFGEMTKSKSKVEEDDKLEGGEEEEEEVPVVDDPEQHVVLPPHIKVLFSERTCLNKVLFGIYRLFRFIFVSVWFYFIPFVAMFASYILPWYF